MAKRVTKEQKQNMTLRELFQFEASMKPDGSVPQEVASHIKRLDGIIDQTTGTPVLDLVVKDIDVGQVFGDVISDSPFRDADLKASPTIRSRSSLLITRLNTMFDGAGFGSGYVKKEVENSLGKDVFNKEAGWEFKRQRKIPTGFQSDVYQKLKSILADDTVPKEMRLQMAGHLFGGFRPENISNFSIENYDREQGILTYYDKKSKKNKFVVVNPAVQGVLDEQIGDRTSGAIFPNAKKNQTALNKLLTNTMEKVTFAKPDGTLKAENFTVYKLRNLNETILTDSGLLESDIDFLNGRKPQTEAAGYVASASRQRRIKRAANELVASIAGYSGTQTVAQFASDIGIKFPEKALQTIVSRDLLVADEYVDSLDDAFLDTLEVEGGQLSKDNVPPPDPETTAQYQAESRAASRVRTADLEATAIAAESQNIEGRASLQKKTDDEIRAIEVERLRVSKIRKEVKDEAAGVAGGDVDTAKLAKESVGNPNPSLTNKLAKFGIKLGAAAAAVTTTAAKSAPLVSAAFIPDRIQDLQNRYGMSKEEATAMAGTEELVPPVGIGMAAKEAVEDVGEAAASSVIEASKEPFRKETGMELTDKNLERGIVSKITGGLSYSSGGFIERRR
jgi:hypothetical protein